jgi:hypothetical protein
MNLRARVPRRMSLSLMLLSLSAMSQLAYSDQEVDSVFDASRALYQELHQHPELSSHEVQTALKIAGELRITICGKGGHGAMPHTTVDPIVIAARMILALCWPSSAGSRALPSNHSPLFAPDFDPALRTGIKAEVAVLRRLLNRTAEELRTTIVEK